MPQLPHQTLHLLHSNPLLLSLPLSLSNDEEAKVGSTFASRLVFEEAALLTFACKQLACPISYHVF